MKNADLPAMPQLGRDPWNNTISNGGLNKREYIATMAMQGIISSNGRHNTACYSEIASDAVMAADELLKALEVKL